MSRSWQQPARSACAALGAVSLAACASMQATRLDAPPPELCAEVIGTPVGAVGGNVLGIVFDRSRHTTTVLGGLVGAGAGYWMGHRADDTLRRAQSAALAIATLEAQAKYAFEQPKLYAHATTIGTEKVATFDWLEVHFPLRRWMRARAMPASSCASSAGSPHASTRRSESRGQTRRRATT
jgi:hypothetical protein